MKEIELNAVPTLVVKSSETKVFVGLKEIAELCSSSVETNYIAVMKGDEVGIRAGCQRLENFLSFLAF
jgi:hypothetical protein